MNAPSSGNQPPSMTDETWSFIRQLWVDTRNELDRSLFLASSAGIGFCMSMLFDKELVSNACVMTFLLIGLVAFSSAAATILLVFKYNAAYLHRLLNDPAASNKDPLLGKLDWIAVGMFILAVLSMLAAIIARLLSGA